MKSYKSVAIDGPSGAGKSTMAKFVASRLGFEYLDTGAIYRAVGLFVKNHGIDSDDEAGITALLGEIKLDITVKDNEQSVFLNGTDVSAVIRQPEISIYASNVSKFAAVRNFLLDMQRSFAENHNVVMDGRDIGTVVLPNANVKIFLTADVSDRARRRYEELLRRGVDVDYETVLNEMRERDFNDSSRKISPLVPAEDAIIIDTTGNTLEKSVDVISKAVGERI